jgi:hypothetical protein
MVEDFIVAVTETIFGYLLDQAGVGDKVRTFLKREPQRLAFQVALTRAYQTFATRHPQWIAALFDSQFIAKSAAPVLAQCLLRDPRPSGEALAAIWSQHLGLTKDAQASRIVEATIVADDFLAILDTELRARDEFQQLFDSRALDTIAATTQQTAETTAQVAEQIAALREELREIFNQLAQARAAGNQGTSGTAPPLPPLMIGRDHDLTVLKQRVGISSQGQEATSVNVLTAMRGWPGVGKTTLAATLAHDAEIQTRFPDGVLWASLGQQPNIFGELAAWGRALGVPNLNDARTVEEVSQLLSGLLRTKRALLIVDDVWEAAHLQPFRVGGAGCAMLLTTRLPEVARAIAPKPEDIYILGVLNGEDALTLLRTLAPNVVTTNEAACRELATDLEGLPLALQVAGRLLQDDQTNGFGVTELLRDLRDGAQVIAEKAPADRADIANQTTPTVAALLELSTNRLDENTLIHFAYLGAFAPKPATFDLAAITSVWDISDPKPMLRVLINRGLLEPIDNRYWMHAILVAHARSFWAEGGE